MFHPTFAFQKRVFERSSAFEKSVFKTHCVLKIEDFHWATNNQRLTSQLVERFAAERGDRALNKKVEVIKRNNILYLRQVPVTIKSQTHFENF